MAIAPRSVLQRVSPSNKRVKLKAKVSDRDLGFDEIVRSIKQLDGMVSSAGVLIEDARKIYPKTKSVLGQVAMANEFGVSRMKGRKGYVPERSFMRDSFDRLNKKWFKKIKNYMAKQTPRDTLNKDVLEVAGDTMKKAIKYTISRKVKPSNAYRTIKRKGFDNPLIETRFLYRHINYQSHKQQP